MAKLRKRQWTTSRGKAKIAWAVDYIDSDGTRARRQFSNRPEADAFRIETEAQLHTGTYRPDARKIAVKEVAEKFLEHCEGRMKRRERMTRHNYNIYAGHVWNYICPDPDRFTGRQPPKRMIVFREGIGGIKLAQLTARRVGDFRDRLRDAGVSVPTTRHILGTLRAMLNYAISRDLVATNAANTVKVIGRRDEGSKKIVPPTKEAIKQLSDVADADFRVKLIFASSTGVRAGELHALRWCHIDFAKAEVKVETRVDAYGEEDVTKTAAGMRTIPISQSLVLLLKQWKLRTPHSKPEDLLFPNRGGSYVKHDTMVKRKFLPLFDKLAKLHAKGQAGHPPAPPRFNWHALRHFAVSCWIEAGLSPKAVQTFAGHSSLQVTMDRYGHLFKSEDHRRAMDAIARDLWRHCTRLVPWVAFRGSQEMCLP